MKMNAEIDCFHSFIFFENLDYIILYMSILPNIFKDVDSITISNNRRTGGMVYYTCSILLHGKWQDDISQTSVFFHALYFKVYVILYIYAREYMSNICYEA